MKFSKFFSNLQEAPWYRAFLNPVINEVSNTGKLLDIGTGSGKLMQILATEKSIECSGVDTDTAMLGEAKVKLNGIDAKLVEIEPNKPLPFEDKSFDYIAICSVLFHFKRDDVDSMLQNSLRLLKESGQIIILTPTGGGNMLKLSKHYFSIKNRGMYVWYRATKKRARIWTKENYLATYANKHKLSYTREVVMNGFAQLEIIKN